MNNSNVSNAAFKPGDDYAFPHSRLDSKLQVIHFEVLDNAGPAGSINSCAADMAKWVQLQLNHRKFIHHYGPPFTQPQCQGNWTPPTPLTTSDPPPTLGC